MSDRSRLLLDIRQAHRRERAAAWREELARKHQAEAIRSERLDRYRKASTWVGNQLDDLKEHGRAPKRVELLTWMVEHFRRLAKEEDVIIQMKGYSK